MWNLVLDLENFSLFARYELFRFGFLNWSFEKIFCSFEMLKIFLDIIQKDLL